MSLVLLLASSALAVDADTYDPAGSTLDGAGGLQVESPTLSAPGAYYGGLQLVYAHNPVVTTSDSGTTSYVSDQFGIHLVGGYTIGSIVRLDLDIPTYPDVAVPGTDYEGGAFGDLRIGGMLPVMRLEDGSPVGLGFKPFIALPTASKEGLVGVDGFSAGLVASAEAKLADNLVISGNFGTTLAPSSTLGSYEFGSTLDWGLGLAYLVNEQLRVGGELNSNIGLVNGIGTFNKNPTELDVYGTYAHESGFIGTLGLGTGIVAGVGAPDFRLVLAAGYHHGAPPDKDKDGIEDKLDQCKDRAEDVDGYKDTDGCPDSDNDGDGLLDSADTCPDQAEDMDGFEDRDGCPETDNDKDGLTDGDDSCPTDPGPQSTDGCPDKDKDGVADRDDACPAVAGPAKSGGCPDTDADLVPDARDLCPTEPKDPREDPAKSDGCPHRVVVTSKRVELNESVYFDTGKTTIKPVSYSLLDEVAKVLNAHPEISKIEIGGHTDSDGDDKKNTKLSQGRADAVVKYLVEQGHVDAARLSGVGYGETRPIDTNQTAEGKAKNRRVELVIQ